MKTRILFVDDEPNILQALRRQLRPFREEWDVVFAGSGEDALAEMARAPADVVVSDMRMPGMNGIELIKRLKPDFPNTRFIVLTAYSNTPLAMEAEQVAAVLHKPVDPGYLIKLLRSLQPATAG